MSLQNLPERFLYERLPQGLIDLDERTLIWAIVSGYQDRIEDLRAYAKKFELFFSPVGLPETGANVVLVDLQSEAGKTYTRSLDLTSDTPEDGSATLADWAAAQLNLEAEAVSNARYGVDLLRLVDANIIDYLATNIGAVLYKSAINENLPTVVTQSGTFTGEQLAHQKLIETYFPRLKFKGTAKSFEQLAKLMGFDDLRMIPLWQRVSPRLPSDPGSPLNDPDFSQVPEYYPQQELGPFYDPLNQADGPFYAWTGTASGGTATTNFYSQVVNGFQPYIKVSVVGLANGTGYVEHPAAGTYVLEGGAPHMRASATVGALQFQALGEGSSWNGVTVDIFTVENGTLRGIGVSDRLSSVKYRSSYFDLSLAIEPDRADVIFGTLTARRNTDLAVAPHLYQSFVGSLTAVSPYRPFVGGTLTLSATPSDFMVPFSGTVVAVAERTEAGLTDYQINYTEMAKAAAQVSQAIEEVRAATRFPRKSTVGWLSDEQVQYAPYVESCFMGSVSSGSITAQLTGTFSQFPLPPYTAEVQFYDGTTVQLGAESRQDFPDSLFYKTVIDRGGTYQGTVTGQITFTGTGSNSYDFLVAGTLASTGTLSAHFTVTSSEVVRPDAWVTSYGTGTWAYAVIGDYGLDIPTVHELQRPTAAMVHSWNPTAIFSTGDNNYYNGDASTIHRNNYAYWEDIRLGRFFPALGNHDWTGGTDAAVHLSYFFNGTLPPPGNGRYFNVRRGNVEWFCVDTGWNSAASSPAAGDPYYLPTNEPDGNTYDSVQGRWLQDALQRSTARWKVVYLHHGPYHSATTSNSYYPGYPRVRWPFKEWGASIVYNGHVHAYERIEVDGLTYITIGNSGENNRTFTTPISPGSKFRYGPGVSPSGVGYGAVRILATDAWFQSEFLTVDGAIRDVVRLEHPRKYQDRPEDDIADLPYETVDDYPWRRDLVAGGELVETDYYTTGTGVQEYLIAEDTTVAWDHAGAPYSVYVADGTATPRFVLETRTTTPYQPGQRAIAFTGEFRDQSNLTAQDLELVVNPQDTNSFRTSFSRSDLDNVFNPGYRLYHAGIVQGVLVADVVRFNCAAHRDNQVGWLPFNEHAEDDFTVRDAGRSSQPQVEMLGVRPAHRVFNTERGWVLDLPFDGVVNVSARRGLGTDFALSFWLYPGTRLADVRVLDFDPVFVDLSDEGTQAKFYARENNGTITLLGQRAVTLNAWSLVCISRVGSTYTVGVGALGYSPITVDSTGDYAAPDEDYAARLIFKAPTSADQALLPATPLLDIVFVIDLSASMAGEIASLVARIGEFDAYMTAQGYDTRYGYATFANFSVPSPYLTFPQDLTTFAAFYAALSLVTTTAGAIELGAQATSLVCTSASWRTGSRRVVVVLTDENDDNDANGLLPDSSKIDQASADLANVGAIFYYVGPTLDLYSTVGHYAGSSQNPYTYQFLADSHGGKGYEIVSFLSDASTMLADIAGAQITAARAINGVGLHDCRIWAGGKTAADWDAIRYHSPVPTEVCYRIGHILNVNRGDRYGLKLLPNGWLTPVNMPAWVRTPKYARAIRYDGRGQYEGESRFKEVGLGGGQVPPYTYQLGQVGYELTAAGTTVVSTQHGAMPGSNAWWVKDATGAQGYYTVLNGSISTGSIAVSTLSGSGVTPWPNPMEATNPFRDRIWVQGLNGTIYEVSLQASSTGASWVAQETGWDGTVQQATGAIVDLSKGGIGISVTTYGSVCQTSVSGTGTTPSLYLYLHENLIEDVGGSETLARWTDPTTFGLQQGVPALQEAGELSFQNSSALVAGNYKLWVDGGNIGKVDTEFDGYKLEITIGDTVIQRTFLPGYQGSNFRGQQEFEFELENDLSGDWLLTFAWSNSARNNVRGTARQLALYGYKLRKLQTSLWQGTIATYGTTPGLNPLPIAGQWTTTPGGWLAQYNAYGTVQTWAHEGTIYPANDTLATKYPLADQLTGVTERRREDILVLPDSVTPSAFFTLPDAADPVIAAFGTDTGVG